MLIVYMILFTWDYGRKAENNVNEDFLKAIRERFDRITEKRFRDSIIGPNMVGFDTIVGTMLSVQEIESPEIRKLNRSARRAMKRNKGNKKHR